MAEVTLLLLCTPNKIRGLKIFFVSVLGWWWCILPQHTTPGHTRTHQNTPEHIQYHHRHLTNS